MADDDSRVGQIDDGTRVPELEGGGSPPSSRSRPAVGPERRPGHRDHKRGSEGGRGIIAAAQREFLAFVCTDLVLLLEHGGPLAERYGPLPMGLRASGPR